MIRITQFWNKVKNEKWKYRESLNSWYKLNCTCLGTFANFTFWFVAKSVDLIGWGWKFISINLKTFESLKLRAKKSPKLVNYIFDIFILFYFNWFISNDLKNLRSCYNDKLNELWYNPGSKCTLPIYQLNIMVQN